jgi:hypothetical protein
MKKTLVALAVLTLNAWPANDAFAQSSETPSPAPSATAAAAATPPPVPVPPGLPIVSTGATKLLVGGVIFVQYKYDLTQNSGNTNGFDVTRAYVNVEPSWGETLSARITTDILRQDPATVGTSGTVTQNTTGSEIIRLKYAFVAYKPCREALFKFGLQQTLFLPWAEDLLGYRVLSKYPEDTFYDISTSDFGASVLFRSRNERHELVVGVFDGETFQKPETNKYKELQARATVTLLPSGKEPGLRLTGYYSYDVKNAQDADKVRAIGLLTWQDRFVTLGAEYVYSQESTAVTPRHTGGGPMFIAVATLPGVHVPMLQDIRVLGRVDFINQDRSVPDNEQTRIVGGVAFRASDRLQFILDYQQLDPQKPGVVTSKGAFAHWEAKF